MPSESRKQSRKRRREQSSPEMSEESSTSTYQEPEVPRFYKHLQVHGKPDKIRLLSFGSRPKEINLGVFDLEKAPQYYALSYCWGDNALKVPIQINGAEILVTSSLAAAFASLRDYCRLKDVNHVWIDQICINQQDPDEVDRQVRIMGQIYRRSVRTLVWLGPGDEQVDGPAFEVIDQIGNDCMENNGWSETECQPDGRHLTRFGIDSHSWRCLSDLFGDPYFSRLWALQEIALSSRDPILIRGGFNCSWWMLEEVCHRVFDGLHVIDIKSDVMLWCPFAVDSTLSHPSFNEKVPWTLEALLMHTRLAETSRPHDYIYGLLGLSAPSLEVIPNYQRDFLRVYAQVTRCVIQDSGRLSILQARVHAHDHTPPSWIPRWDLGPQYDQAQSLPCWADTFITETSEHTLLRRFQDRIHYKASLGYGAELGETNDELEMKLKGLQLDQIAWQSGPFPNYTPRRLRIVSLIKSWEQFLQKLQLQLQLPESPSLAGLEDAAQRFCTTTQLDLALSSERATKISTKIFWGFLVNAYDKTSDLNPALNSQPSEALLEAYKTLSRTAADGVGDDTTLSFLRYGRRIVILQSGKLGMGPWDACDGDQVFLLFGGRAPFVLRPVFTGYLYIGEMYLEDYMDGQAIEQWQAGRLTEQRVTLV